MPASIIAAVVAIGTFIQGSAIAQFAITFAVSTIVSRVFGTKKPPKSTFQDTGVRQQIPPSTVNSIPVVYGDAYTGGMFVDAVLSQNQKVMYYALAISSISANGQFTYDQDKFYYGDRLITFDSSDRTKVISLTDGDGNVNTKINGNLFINLYVSDYLGNITSLNGASAPSVVMAYSSSNQNTVPSAFAWPSTGRQMNGLAFAIVKLIYNQEAETTQLQAVTFHCSHYLNGTGCAKPGDVWTDYMTNPYYGGAVDSSLMDTASATALNSYADQTITYVPSGGGSATQPRYRINGVVDTSLNVIDNVDNIMTCCDSWMAYNAAAGQWSVIINKPETSSMSLDDSNIIGEIRVGAIDINQSVNQVEAKFPNKFNKDILDFVFMETPSYLLWANEPINKLNIDFELVNDNVQAQYLANRILEQAREDLTVSLNTTYEGIQINVGDVVDITNAAYGWTNKAFRVMKVNETVLPDGNLGAAFEMNEYNPLVYDDVAVTQFAPAPNSGLPDLTYFGTLAAPTVTDQLPNAAVPTFSVDCIVPPNGQVTTVTLYYTNVASPLSTDWNLWGFQTASNSQPFTAGSTIKFAHINLPTDTYYFAFKVSNLLSQSVLSATSTSYNWTPNPASSAVAGTFVPQFSPNTLQVPFDGTTASFTGIIAQLYGTAAGGAIDFVASQDDSDAAFVNNTWRIGASSTTGYADIVKSGITIGNPTDGGFYAVWPLPTAMSTNPATITVPVRYKSSSGTVTQAANATLQFVYAITGTAGKSARICYSKTTLSSLASTPTTITTAGSTSFPANDSWGIGTIWQATAPAIVAGESVYQSDGIYDPATNITTWNVPYISALKVGQLSAISADLGVITAGNITLNTTGYIRGGQTAYNTGTGFFLGYSGAAYKFSIGSSTGSRLTYDGTNLTLVGNVSDITQYASGSILLIQDTTNCTYSQSLNTNPFVKVKEIQISKGGTVSVNYKFTVIGSSLSITFSSRIYVNGVATGALHTNTGTSSPTQFSYTDTITVATGDLIQLYFRTNFNGTLATINSMSISVNTYYQNNVTYNPTAISN